MPDSAGLLRWIFVLVLIQLLNNYSERIQHVFTLSVQHVHMPVFTWCWRGSVCGLRLSGSSSQPSDKGIHYFGLMCLQVAKQHLFNHRKQKKRKGVTPDAYLCVRHKPSGAGSSVSKPAIWQQRDTFKAFLNHFSLALANFVGSSATRVVGDSESVWGEWHEVSAEPGMDDLWGEKQTGTV